MPTTVQYRRGTTAETALFTGAEGELTVDTTKSTAVVHDNLTPGGHPLVTESRLAATPLLAAGTTQARNLAARFGDAVNVFDLGAKGDGVADDTAAFRAAVATGRPVVVPQTTAFYRLTNSVSLPANAVVVGLGLPLIKYLGTVNNIGVFQTTGTGAILRDLMIDGGSTKVPATPFQTACVLVTHNDFTCENVSTVNCRQNGISLQNVSGALVRGGKVTAGGGPGIILTNCSLCTIDDLDLSTTATHFGCYLNNGTNRCTFRNLRCFNDIATHSLELIGVTYPCWGNRIEGCHAEGTGDNGISVTGYSNVVVGNVCRGNYHAGICVYGKQNTVTGNLLANNGQRFPVDGLSFPNLYVSPAFGGEARDNVLVGNSCFDDQAVPTAEAGVKLGTSSYNVWAAGKSFSSSNRYCYNGLNVYAALSLVGTAVSGSTAPTHTSGTVSDGVIEWTYLHTGVANLNARDNIVVGNSSKGHRTTDAISDATGNTQTVFQKDAMRAGVTGTNSSPAVRVGNTFPTGSVSGNVGDLFLRAGGGTGITAYLKEAGNGTTANWTPVMTRTSGATSARPTLGNGFQGFMFFDTTLNKPIWADGAGGWRDATGTAV